MNIYRLYYHVNGAGYVDVEANNIEEAIEKEKQQDSLDFHRLCDDEWEFDEEYTRDMNDM